MRAETQESDVTPDAGVKFLRVSEQERRRGHRVRVRSEVRDVRNSLLFVHNQILDHVQIFGARLKCEMPGGVAIRAAVVHVDMHVAAPPSLAWKVGNALESYTLRDSPTRRHVHVGTINAILRSVPNLDMNLSRRHG